MILILFSRILLVLQLLMGLMIVGYPYDWSSPSATGLSDVLTSKPINLLGTVGDVYFSFLYQGGGIGEVPDQFDSLTLEFWSPVTSQWFSVWNTTGSSSSTFTQVLFEVSSAQYKQDGFQFRFKSYGSLTGSWIIGILIMLNWQIIGLSMIFMKMNGHFNILRNRLSKNLLLCLGRITKWIQKIEW